jgi:HEPN domain-containing protein
MMKALLIDRKVAPPKTHNLVDLHKMIGAAEPAWLWDERELDWLSRAAVNYRYPGNTANRQHAAKAIELCSRLRIALRGFIS